MADGIKLKKSDYQENVSAQNVTVCEGKGWWTASLSKTRIWMWCGGGGLSALCMLKQIEHFSVM